MNNPVKTLPYKLNGLARRLNIIKQHLGLYYVAFWRTKPESAINLFTYLCRDRLGWKVSETYFTIVQPFELRRAGVLIKVSSSCLRDKILSNVSNFKNEGFNVAQD